MTKAQEECNRFETLSEQIVHYIFKNTDAKITRTDASKDGGYDIVVECNEGNKKRKIYFECKLRGGNLNLRDIAANVIIAFNEGAVSLAIFTNYNYTKQANEHLRYFHKKTILNIKIIVGEQINRLVEICSIPISENLASLIGVKKSKMKFFDRVLQIDLSQSELHHQFLHRKSEDEQSKNRNIYLTSRNKELLESTRFFLLQGGIVAISGVIGSGKSTFYKALTCNLDSINIHIDASLHRLQEHLLLDILLTIWGIPGKDIIDDFTIDHIDAILGRLTKKYSDEQTIYILRRLFGDKSIKGINNEQYNIRICEYILHILNLHHSISSYLFCIRNLQYASSEIQNLLTYFTTRLQDYEIPCIILWNKEEYEIHIQQEIDLQNTFKSHKKFKIVKLYLYTQQEAVEYIKHSKPEISDYLAKLIVDRIGIRQGNITMFLRYLDNTQIPLEDYQRIALEIENLPPNHIPALTDKVMNFYRYKYRNLFHIIYLLRGKVSESLLTQMDIQLSNPDKLVEEDILVYHNEWYSCANPVVWSIIEDWGKEGSPEIRRIAAKILKISLEQKDPCYETCACIQKYLGQFEEAEKNLRHHILQLRESRQLDALIQSYDIAIELAKKQRNSIALLDYIIQQIEILIIKKEILSKKVDTRLTELKKILNGCHCPDVPQHFYFAYDYFIAKRDFKNGIYNTSKGNGALLKEYYEKASQGFYRDNTEDWLGKLCYQYALYVKESQGNDAAWIIFQEARRLLPSSFTIQREYYSHLGCIKLYSDPEEAFIYYCKIVDMFKDNPTLCALPFHEYVDKAMTKLLAGNAYDADNLAQEAISICEAHRVIDEWGRALNIKGCAMVHLDKPTEALVLFKESYRMLKTSGYKLFSWRSQLNYIQQILNNNIITDQLREELKDAYDCFLSLFRNKINTLVKEDKNSFTLTREYHALLLFGICVRKMKLQKLIKPFADLDIEIIKKKYDKDLRQVINNPEKALAGSPYFRTGIILMMG